MADQDAQDINQMMSAAPEVEVAKPRKSKFLWIVLGCVVVGVGLGVVVYQQSVKPTPVVKTTPRPTAVPQPSPTEAPVTPDVNAIQPLANTITFPKTGKLRVFSDVANNAMVFTIKIGTTSNTLTLPSRPVTTANPMNFTDSTFEVTAGSTGTLTARLGTASGPKMYGWLLPRSATECGAPNAIAMDITAKLAWVQSHLATGQTVFVQQCWADENVPGDTSSDDFNDFYLAWSYATSSSASPSPSGSATASSSPSPSASAVASVSPSPSPSRAASPSPSPSVAGSPAGGTAVISPTPSPRAAMPDTTGGVPVTGIFEVTVGTISVGLILLILGLFGLLAL